MEVMVAAQSGTLLHALRVQLKRRVSTRRGGDYNILLTKNILSSCIRKTWAPIAISGVHQFLLFMPLGMLLFTVHFILKIMK
jgi:hypothetical protein